MTRWDEPDSNPMQDIRDFFKKAWNKPYYYSWDHYGIPQGGDAITTPDTGST